MSGPPADPRALEALLFLSPDPLHLDALAEIMECDRDAVAAGLDIVAERHDERSGLELAQVAGGYALRTRADLAEVCDRLRERPAEDRLSPAALETLAVVAYLEPVSRPDISRLRGVSVDSTVANLVDRGLLEEVGRTDGAGAMRYRTTRAFQKRFGLADRRDLPPIERFELSGPQAEELRRSLVEAGHLPAGPPRALAGEGDAADAPDQAADGPDGAPRTHLVVTDDAGDGPAGDDDDAGADERPAADETRRTHLTVAPPAASTPDDPEVPDPSAQDTPDGDGETT